MENLLPMLLGIPLVGLLVSFLFTNKDEKPIYWATNASIILNFLTLLTFTALWVGNDFESVFYHGLVLYHSKETEFAINFFMDGYGLTYMLVATFITMIVTIFSRFYIHREKGYKRFFNNLLFFYFGLMMVLLAGNLETLFIGWEVLGVTSFFLIGFYRERYLPVKNALKVVSLYRVADIALLLAIWVCHHYFGHSLNFHEVTGLHNPQSHILHESFYQFFIPSVFLVAAMVKSAQVPFSSWLPRAMEGPTTSSAIFYGSLSVHIGVFLLIRTSAYWDSNLMFHLIIGSIGALTCIMATVTARVQSSIKTQIAYSSIAQIGLMFIEVALGWYEFAVFHFACNAFLRSYQLLVSPSILSYRIHDQFFHFITPAEQPTTGFLNKLKMSFYILGIKEFNLDTFMYRYLWNPLKRVGRLFDFMDDRITYIIALPPFLMGLWAVYNQELLPHSLSHYLPEIFAVVGLVFVLKSFVERKSSLNAWVLLVVSQLYQSFAFSFNEEFAAHQIYLYLSGIFVCAFLGIWVLNMLNQKGEDISLDKFHGHSYVHPKFAFVFVIACLGLAGFPITPTFIGEDLMLSHIHENQYPLLLLIVLNLILDGLVIFRIYSRLFLGQHKNGRHEVAYRSS